MSNLQVGCPEELILLAVIDGGREVEEELHARFADYRIRGEWFERCDELMDFIEGSSSFEILYEMRATGIKNVARHYDKLNQ